KISSYYHETCGTSLPVLLVATTLATITSSVRKVLLAPVCPVYCCCCNVPQHLTAPHFPLTQRKQRMRSVDE
ncbi:hypothetical protein WUBG_16319, partial [Wuchereria bancrofti]